MAKSASPSPRRLSTGVAAEQPAATVRIRNNQRRSRANRKAYVASLERKLEEYSARGIQATVEMQSAARAVATENQRLRALLCKIGVSPDEVTAYLQSFRAPDGPSPATTSEELAADRIQKPSTRQGHDDDPSGKVTAPEERVRSPAPVDARNIHGPRRTEYHPIDTDTDCGLQDSPPRAGGTSRLCSSGSSGSSTLETPCETAASIILRMRGQDDESAVYSRFGCENGFPQGCRIRNTDLFQIMDEV
ncbi:hypothetical protein DRE_01217 [Drechslerella stenobrocha 248]|uniref:BZIP domain-containing protein n=1 Tax=Drechslerella stenobrocha 248 TaxID=1043628 RepID=W7HK54_9PEZI|nr:hypothetical protein DRE_01217 [Drechslerella stenobrocha 248]